MIGHTRARTLTEIQTDVESLCLYGGARVLSDGLRALYDKLMEAQAKMASPR